MTDRPKHENLLAKVAEAVELGNFRFSEHARKRMAERNIVVSFDRNLLVVTVINLEE